MSANIKEKIYESLFTAILSISGIILIFNLLNCKFPFLIVFTIIIVSASTIVSKIVKIPISILWIAISLIIAFIGINLTVDGLAIILNKAIYTYTKIHPRIYETFYEQNIGLTWILCIFSVIWTILCHTLIVSTQKKWIIFLLILLMFLSVIFAPIITVRWLIVSVIYSLIWYIVLNSNKKQWNISLRFCFRMIIPFLILIILMGSIDVLRSPPNFFERINRFALTEINFIRYGKTEGLTDGDLTRVENKKHGKRTALIVTMNKPTSYYFRGFVGERYENNCWQELRSSDIASSKDSFYWMHKGDFYPQTILATANNIVAPKQDKNKIIIKNKGASSKYIYAPYEIHSDYNILDRKDMRDATIRTGGISGKRNYSFFSSTQLVPKYQEIGYLLDQNSQRGDVAKYLDKEGIYNKFVYNHYMEIPSNIRASISNKLSTYELDEGQSHFDYQRAKQNILFYLTNDATYKEKTAKLSYKADRILDFLDGSKEGYDVHYASAATMMFRYYGIPARYVEGYIITKEEAQKAKTGQKFDLDTNHAHVWTEYYHDGIGWIPFEPTPSYFSLMEQPDNYKNISGMVGRQTNSKQENNQNSNQTKEQENPEFQATWLKDKHNIIFIVILLIFLIAMGCFVSWIVRERKKVARMKMDFLSAAPKEAICQIYDYIIDILRSQGMKIKNCDPSDYRCFLDADLRNMYDQSVLLRQEAYFSAHQMTEKDRQVLISLKNELWGRMWEKSGFLQRIRIKYLLFL